MAKGKYFIFFFFCIATRFSDNLAGLPATSLSSRWEDFWAELARGFALPLPPRLLTTCWERFWYELAGAFGPCFYKMWRARSGR